MFLPIHSGPFEEAALLVGLTGAAGRPISGLPPGWVKVTVHGLRRARRRVGFWGCSGPPEKVRRIPPRNSENCLPTASGGRVAGGEGIRRLASSPAPIIWLLICGAQLDLHVHDNASALIIPPAVALPEIHVFFSSVPRIGMRPLNLGDRFLKLKSQLSGETAAWPAPSSPVMCDDLAGV